MYVFLRDEKTILVKLKDLFPECPVLLDKYPNLTPLNCFKENFCPANTRCMEMLAPRINWLFDTFKGSVLMVVYFKTREGRLAAGVFWGDGYADPKVIRIGPKGWIKLKERLEMYEVSLPSELSNTINNKKVEELVQISTKDDGKENSKKIY